MYNNVYTLIPYFGLLTATVLFEFAYLNWTRSAVGNSPTRTALWGTAVAGLGLIGFGGALQLPGGWVLYLIAVLAGGYFAAVRNPVR